MCKSDFFVIVVFSFTVKYSQDHPVLHGMESQQVALVSMKLVLEDAWLPLSEQALPGLVGLSRSFWVIFSLKYWHWYPTRDKKVLSQLELFPKEILVAIWWGRCLRLYGWSCVAINPLGLWWGILKHSLYDWILVSSEELSSYLELRFLKLFCRVFPLLVRKRNYMKSTHLLQTSLACLDSQTPDMNN